MSIRFITRADCVAWCEEHHFPIQAAKPAPAAAGRVTFRVPPDAGARVSLCRLLWKEAAGGSGDQKLIWVTDWSVWPSGEHLPLWERLRQALGTSQSLTDAPGCVCGPSDEEDGLSLFLISCLYLWDCWLLTDSGVAVFLSHDEFGELFEQSPRPTTTESELRRLGLTR